LKLLEYEGKKIFSEYGIQIPKGKLFSAGDDPNQFKFPVAIKAQVLMGSRGKKGLISFAENKKQMKEQLSYLLNLNEENTKIYEVLIEEKLTIKQEIYASIFVDRTTKRPLLTVGSVGGIDIESADRNKIITRLIDPYIGLSNFILREIINKINPKDKILEKKMTDTIKKLYKIYKDYEAELVEINPLVISTDNQLIAADAKIIIDNGGLFRCSKIDHINKYRDLSIFENEIESLGATGVEINKGNVGVVTSGAGLLMTTIDTIEQSGGSVKAGVDIASIAFDKESKNMIELLTSLKKIPLKAILLNFFLQIGRCDVFAQAINSAFHDCKEDISIIVRLKGNKANLAKKILSAKKYYVTEDFEDAVNQVIKKSI